MSVEPSVVTMSFRRRASREGDGPWVPWAAESEGSNAPLAGHAGSCDRVTKATVTGEIGPCTCAAAMPFDWR